MLGRALLSQLSRFDVFGIDKENCDITDRDSLRKTIGKTEFDVVVHCAAYTNVDGAEGNAKEAFLINEKGTENIIEALGGNKCLFIYISTDYVFDGNKKTAYTEEDAVAPLNVYGKSKLAGERLAAKLDKHLIIRTSWLFGPNGKNFVSTIFHIAKEKEAISVVCDQIGSPTYTIDLANAISEIIDIHFKRGVSPGVYNITNTGFCSWAQLARYIIKESGLKTKVLDIKSEELSRAAKRPGNSMLSKERFKAVSGYELRPWRQAVKHYLKNFAL